MQLYEIREEVQLIVQDTSFTDDMIDSYINDVYFSVVARSLVPELKGVDTVATTLSVAYSSMSGVDGGFSGVLSRVYNSTGEQLTIYPKLEDLMDVTGNLTDAGAVEAVVLEGSTLWYYPIPATAETLILIYYKNPDLLDNESDIPTAIPEFLHRQILVNGVAAICFDIIEGGVEGVKVNMRSRELAKEAGVIKFKEWLGKTRKHYVVSQEPF